METPSSSDPATPRLPGTVLVIGACGQLGLELTAALRQRYRPENVIAADVRPPKNPAGPGPEVLAGGPFEQLDVLDQVRLNRLMHKYQPQQVYHLAALLSATAEKDPLFAWKLNMDGLFNVLNLAVQHQVAQVYWPSSIAVFGPDTPRHATPQTTITNPNTVYGISKLAGEQWCEWYHRKHGLDVRSLRYPGLIGYKSLPGGGTTDYAVDIYHRAVAGEEFTCFLKEDTCLPMMYMPDALKATLDLMHAPAERIRVRTSYNLGAMSFAPRDVAAAIRQEIPGFRVRYAPDGRQAIADSWPASIDDRAARADWGWQPAYDLAKMTKDMLAHLREPVAA